MKDTLSILSHYFRTKYIHSFSSRKHLGVWQEKKVLHLLKNILPHSPFYQRQFKGLSVTEWRKLPLIDKTVMMSEFDELNTIGITKKEAFQVALEAEERRNFSKKIDGITVGLSSGTSGNRGLFLVSEEEQRQWVGTLLAKILPGPLYKAHRLALFLRANSNLYTSVEKGRVQFCFFDLFQSIEENAQRVDAYQPTLLVAPPSMLRFLAQYQKEGMLNLYPEKIVSVAEVLDPIDKLYIEEAFNQRLHQLYQCTEGFLASTCSYGTLHVNEDLLVMEKHYLDKELGKFSPIITDFTRTSQPIIRYHLNDILTEKRGSCPCGSPFMAIEQIEGRCDDLFYFPQKGNDDHLVPIFPDFIRRAILIASLDIEEYLVIQHTPHQLEIQLHMKEAHRCEAKEAVERSLKGLFDKQSCTPPLIIWTTYHHKAGPEKLRRVKRNFTV